MTDTVNAELYDPFQQGDQAYLGSMDVEIGFASQKKRVDAPYDQDGDGIVSEPGSRTWPTDSHGLEEHTAVIDRKDCTADGSVAKVPFGSAVI